MACNGEESRKPTRDSYVSTELRGLLEKKGVLGKKTKLLCAVQDSSLVMQKKHGDPSKTIALTGSHLVRKVTSDITGTHFEICERKKSHVFVCPTSEECTAWVRSLQAAMALKDLSLVSPDPDMDADRDINVYENPDTLILQTSNNENPAVDREYTKSFDVENKSNQPCSYNFYCEVDVHGGSQLNELQATSTLLSCESGAPCTRQSGTERIYTDAASEAAKQTNNSSTESNSNFTTQTLTGTPPSRRMPSFSERHSLTIQNSEGVVSEQCSEANAIASESVSQEGQNSGEENPFQILDDALSDDSSPLPDFIHPLSDEDWKPVNDLTHFLRSNDKLCRVSSSLGPVTEDPVNILKSFLEKVNVAARKTGES